MGFNASLSLIALHRIPKWYAVFFISINLQFQKLHLYILSKICKTQKSANFDVLGFTNDYSGFIMCDWKIK